MGNKKKIYVCCGTGCIAKNSMSIFEEFRDKIHEMEIDAEVSAKLTSSVCSGICDKGPVVKIYPNITYYGVKIKDVEEIIQRTVVNDEIVSRLIKTTPSMKEKLKDYHESGFYKRQYKVALKNVDDIDPTTIDQYIEKGGYEALKEVLLEMKPEIIIGDRNCMVDVVKDYLNFLSKEFCGKCIPCREGVKRMLEMVTDICEGNAKERDIENMLQMSYVISQASLCNLGKRAQNPIMIAIRYFRDEFEEHLKNKRCRQGVCKNLTTFYIDKDKCMGCNLCKKNCDSNCITGEFKKPHEIDESKCIRCGNCIDICRFDAIKIL